MLSALTGVRVIDMTHMIAGPYGTKLMADFGADVIKVEARRRPDGFRYREGRHQSMSRSFTDFNRGKRGLAIDLNHPRGRELMLRLVEKSDIVVENFSTRVLEKWDLTYERLQTVNPRLVMVSTQGLGRTGPYRDYVAWGPSILSMSGITYLWNHPATSEPVGSQTAHPDYVAGVNIALTAMAGLLHRERTGRGTYMEVAQLEAMAGLLGPVYLDYLLNNRSARPKGNRHRHRAPWGCYPCRGEDEWCMITVETETQWQNLLAVMGPGRWHDSEFASPHSRHAHQDRLDGLIAGWTRSRTAETVMQILQEANVPAGIVATGEQLNRDPQLQHRGFITHVENPNFRDIDFPGPPVRMTRTPGRADRRAPEIGEHSAEIARDLMGLAAEDWERLKTEGVIG